MQQQETILTRLGKALHGHLDGVVAEPMPERWVDLIRYLNEKERLQSESDRPKIEPRTEHPSSS